VFVNPAKTSADDANWDAPGSVNVPVTSSFQKPQINATDLRHIVATMAEDIASLKKEMKSLKETKDITESEVAKRSLIEKKLSLEQQMENMDDRSKEVIQKLLGAAQQLRTGTANIMDNKTSAVSSSLTEEIEPQQKTIKISTSKLHEMLLKTTSKLKNNRTENLERLADSISTLIAESLLTNENVSLDLLKETTVNYNKLVK
jgi:cell division protein FtsB